MDKKDLFAFWDKIEKDLEKVKSMLPKILVEQKGSLKQYNEYIDANELALALDELIYLGEDNGCNRQFWLALRDLAIIMELG